MSRSYVCDGPDCGLVMDGPAMCVQYCVIEDADDDEPMDCETHFCGFVCLSAWATSVALDYPPVP